MVPTVTLTASMVTRTKEESVIHNATMCVMVKKVTHVVVNKFGHSGMSVTIMASTL